MKDFDPQSQVVGSNPENPLAQGGNSKSQAGGSEPTPQVTRMKQGSGYVPPKPSANPQKFRG